MAGVPTTVKVLAAKTSKASNPHQIQRSLLPAEPPELAGYTFAARSIAATTVGGDFYDFIDVGEEESRRLIVEEFEQALRADSARTKVMGLSELGLLQLTRKRSRPAISSRRKSR